MKSTRRDFIRTIILSSGAIMTSWKDVAAMRASQSRIPTGFGTLNHHMGHSLLRDGGAMPSFAPPTKQVDTVIVGGGMSGLAAAWRLKRERKDFLLLENEAAVGGVMKYPVPTWHGIPYPLGSTYFFRNDNVFKRFYHDIGVKPYETAEDALYIENGAAVVDWWNPKVIDTLPYAAKDREAFKQFSDKLLVMEVPNYPLSHASPDEVKRYDSISARSFVDQFGSDILRNKLDSYSRSVLGAPLAEVNAYSFLNFYSLEFGMSFDIPCHTCAGGLGEIAQKAQEFIGDAHTQTNAIVVNVENRSDGNVLVQYLEQTMGEGKSLIARSVIMATQKNIARHVVRGLPEAQAAAMGKIRYAPYVTVALCCNAPLFEVRAFDFWFSDPKGRFTDIIDVTSTVDIVNGNPKRREGDFVYMLSAPRPESERASVLDEVAMTEYAQTVAHAVEEFVPGALDKIVEMHVFGWGHSLVIPSVGSHQALYPISSARHGNILFANADNDIAPGVENAFLWGVEAAEHVIDGQK